MWEDWDRDGIDTIGVFKDGRWQLDLNGDGTIDANEQAFEFGKPGDLPVVGDFDGDGIDEIAVYRGGVWYVDTNAVDEQNDRLRELLKAGKLGRPSRIEQVRNGDKPYWYEYLKPDVRAADLDWKAFTKGRTKKAFDPILYSGWYGYWEFSQGPVPQWDVHFLALVHYIAGLGIPEACVCLGGVFTWKDEHRFTAPDQVQALWHYPDGLMI